MVCGPGASESNKWMTLPERKEWQQCGNVVLSFNGSKNWLTYPASCITHGWWHWEVFDRRSIDPVISENSGIAAKRLDLGRLYGNSGALAPLGFTLPLIYRVYQSKYAIKYDIFRRALTQPCQLRVCVILTDTAVDAWQWFTHKLSQVYCGGTFIDDCNFRSTRRYALD